MSRDDKSTDVCGWRAEARLALERDLDSVQRGESVRVSGSHIVEVRFGSVEMITSSKSPWIGICRVGPLAARRSALTASAMVGPLMEDYRHLAFLSP